MTERVAPRSAAAPGAARAARFAAGGTVAVAVIIVALHAIKPELEPSWRFISEYAIGRHGWLMQLAFVNWAASCAALALGLRREVQTRRGRAGVGILLVVAAALVFAGLFPSDPITAGPAAQSASGTVHAIASMIGIPGLPLAAMLISSSLWRTAPGWASDRGAIMGAAHLTWISLVLMAIYLMWAVPRAGGFNMEVWAGWMNRLVVATYLAWQLVVARRLVAHSAVNRF